MISHRARACQVSEPLGVFHQANSYARRCAAGAIQAKDELSETVLMFGPAEAPCKCIHVPDTLISLYCQVISFISPSHFCIMSSPLPPSSMLNRYLNLSRHWDSARPAYLKHGVVTSMTKQNPIIHQMEQPSFLTLSSLGKESNKRAARPRRQDYKCSDLLRKCSCVASKSGDAGSESSRLYALTHPPPYGS